MKWIKLFEDFEENQKKPDSRKQVKNNNQEGTLIKEEDLINCIKAGGVIYAKTIKGLKDIKNKDIKHKEEDPITPVSVDSKTVTVDIDNNTFEIDLSDITKIEY
jgi:hypothetical protein